MSNLIAYCTINDINLADMKKSLTYILQSKLLAIVFFAGGYCLLATDAMGQNPEVYKAPQDTVKRKLDPNASLTTYITERGKARPDSRIVGAATKAAQILTDTTKYDKKKGVSVSDLFDKEDLVYVSRQGIYATTALFEQINQYLPKDNIITFRTDQDQETTISENPLVLKNLRALIAAKPATISTNGEQWKENVYHAYMERDYGTKLNNTITITSATRIIREAPDLEIIDENGSNITLRQILKKALDNNRDKVRAEMAAVAEFRGYTFPNNGINQKYANENYKRALFELIRLQEGDINRHPESKKLVELMTFDLRKGQQSTIINALKNSRFFDANVPGNLGPVLLTETQVINGDRISKQAEAKAMEITVLTSLHYGERDAVKLLKQMLNNKGSIPARQTGDFTAKRLSQLTYHGTEKLKSLGYGNDKTRDMSSTDLVLVAVSAPESPAPVNSNAYISLRQAGITIINHYSNVEIQESRSTVLFNPRIKMSSHHMELRTAFDPVDFVPELDLSDGEQQGSRVVHNGIEFRVESDIYFSNPNKIAERGIKPIIYPEFGIVYEMGRRKVGYDDATTLGQHGEVPKFKQKYRSWGGHLGLNIGPVLLGSDATILSSPSEDDPYKRFFDLSSGMTYFRYSALVHVLNLGMGKIDQGSGSYFTLDAEFAGETNNEWAVDITHTQNTSAQTKSIEWKRDYDRAHPGGQYNHQIATEMILNGDTKASYAAANYAALHLGIQKSNFHIKGSVGLYNIQAIDGQDKGGWEWSKEVFSNTIKGNFYAGLGLTYNFGSGSIMEKRRKTETYQTNGNAENIGEKKVENSDKRYKTSSGPRNHSIFTNRKSRIKPVAKEIE